MIVSLPVAMVFANRSAPLFLFCAAAFVAAARLLSGSGGSYLTTLRRLRLGALIVPLCALAYLLISASWAIRPESSFFALGEAVIPILSSVILIISWRAASPPKWLFKALARAMLVAAGLIAVELLLDAPIRQIYGGRTGPFVQNRPVVTLLILLWPVLAWSIASGRIKLSCALLFAVTSTIVISDSEAAKFGLLAAAGTAVVVYTLPERISRVFAFALIGLIWIQPVFGDLVASLTPPHLIELTKAGHSQERIQIWQAFGEVARDHPIIGTGFASSPHMGSHPIMAEVDPAFRRPLEMGHPHNTYLQVWVELGLPGALLLSWFIFLVVSRLSEAPSDIRRMGLITLMCTSAIALVSHGAWQGWWIAIISLAAALLSLRRSASRHMIEPTPERPGTNVREDQLAQSLTV